MHAGATANGLSPRRAWLWVLANPPSACYTNGMKVAVSIPDPIFAEADRLAQRLKATRSEIYARALKAFVATHSPDQVTEAINDVVDALDEPHDGDFVREAARRVLDRTEW